MKDGWNHTRFLSADWKQGRTSSRTPSTSSREKNGGGAGKDEWHDIWGAESDNDDDGDHEGKLKRHTLYVPPEFERLDLNFSWGQGLRRFIPSLPESVAGDHAGTRQRALLMKCLKSFLRALARSVMLKLVLSETEARTSWCVHLCTAVSLWNCKVAAP